MAVWVAFLRGINVGGNRKLPMAELRSLCEEAGLTDVRTYIASGNLVFSSTMRSSAKVRELIEQRIEEHFGFPVVVVVRTPKQLREVVDGLPFDDADHAHVSFMVSGSERAATEELQEALINDARLEVVGDHAYLLVPNGLGQGFLRPGADRKFGKVGTVRNWRTVGKVLAMAEGD
ncbi:DUF1697 domain-containing protein [Angustibacter sp. McL0619]|uniref:DUF1697 domain-containing protein n=1 Tax=Angustibacter sp. McL0619 TaxID=3415676 RepID=UPI003CE9E8BA